MRLYLLLVQDVMDQSFPQLYKDELATKARALLRSRGLRVIPVVDDNKRLVGMVSRGDVMTITSSISSIRVRGIMSHPMFIATIGMVFQRLRSGAIDQVLQTPVIETATGDVVMVERNVDAGEAAKIMLEKGVGTMPVLENEKLVGMITERDFFKLVA